MNLHCSISYYRMLHNGFMEDAVMSDLTDSDWALKDGRQSFWVTSCLCHWSSMAWPTGYTYSWNSEPFVTSVQKNKGPTPLTPTPRLCVVFTYCCFSVSACNSFRMLSVCLSEYVNRGGFRASWQTASKRRRRAEICSAWKWMTSRQTGKVGNFRAGCRVQPGLCRGGDTQTSRGASLPIAFSPRAGKSWQLFTLQW